MIMMMTFALPIICTTATHSDLTGLRGGPDRVQLCLGGHLLMK